MKKLVIDTSKTEEGYSASCDSMPGWVVGYAGDFAGFREYVKESIDFWLEGTREDGEEYDAIFDSEYELQFKFDVQSLLYTYRNVFSFSALENITGINQRQLCHYASGLKKPRKVQAERIAHGLHHLAAELNAVTV